MNCPICNHDKFNFWMTISQQTYTRRDISGIGLDPPAGTPLIESVLCSKCGVLLYDSARGWRDWSGSHLYWDEENKMLKIKSIPKYKSDSTQGLIRALKSLPQEVIDSLREQIKEA